jgi:hypothetical protein
MNRYREPRGGVQQLEGDMDDEPQGKKKEAGEKLN